MGRCRTDLRAVCQRRPRIQIGLDNRVSRRESRRRANGQAGNISRCYCRERPCPVLHIRHADVSQADIARVSDGVSIGHDIADGQIAIRTRDFCEINKRCAGLKRNCLIIRWRRERAACRCRIGCRCIGDRRAGINVGLGHGIGRCEINRRTRREAGHIGGCNRGQCAGTAMHVGNARIGQADITRIGQCIGIGDDITHSDIRRDICHFDERRCRGGGFHVNRFISRDRIEHTLGRRGRDSGGIANGRSRINVGLGHSVIRRERHAIADSEGRDTGWGDRAERARAVMDV